MRETPPGLQVLERLYQMRQRAVEKARSQLLQQNQLCQRYHNNIEALRALSDSGNAPITDAVQMSNQARFKASIQRVIDWQQQEKALATVDRAVMQRELTQCTTREMTLDVVMAQQKAAFRQALTREEQKITDAQAMQSWLRRQRIENPESP